MKLSLSLRGWTGLSFAELQESASEMRFQGVELYNIHKFDNFTGPEAPFNPYHIQSTLRSMKEKKLEIPCIDSSCELVPAEEDNIRMLIRASEDFRVPYTAVCCHEDDEETALSVLSRLIPFARDHHVCLLIKTSGIYADTARLRRVLDSFACDEVGALWDVHHPYRDFDELPGETVEHLGAYIHHVHLRDSNDDGTYNLVGEGTLPIPDVMRALSSVDYDAYISLEWKPEWMEELQDYSVIFPHFVSFMARFDEEDRKTRLFKNHDGTGEYVWKKDELIDLTFSRVLDRMVEEFPDQYAFKYTTLDYTRTYSEFREDVDNFARALVSLGVRPGHKVSIWATNVPEWFITFWATTKIGAILVTVNTAYKIHEAEYLFRQSDTHTLVMIESSRDSDYKGIINELCPEIKDSTPGEPLHCRKLPFLRNVITVGFRNPGCLTFEEAMERKDLVPKSEILSMASKVKTSDVCNMQYTSGTTGFPKGVMLTHYNVVNNGKCIGDRMGLSTADRMMIQVPMFHCFGMVLSMTASLTHGATVCPMPYFSAKTSLACINQEKITCFNGVPTMFIAMFNHPSSGNPDG